MNQELLIFPNPSNGQFNIQLEGDYTFEVLDSRGRLVINDNANENHTIDLSEYEAGVYYIRINRDGEIAVRKLMLK